MVAAAATVDQVQRMAAQVAVATAVKAHPAALALMVLVVVAAVVTGMLALPMAALAVAVS